MKEQKIQSYSLSTLAFCWWTGVDKWLPVRLTIDHWHVNIGKGRWVPHFRHVEICIWWSINWSKWFLNSHLVDIDYVWNTDVQTRTHTQNSFMYVCVRACACMCVLSWIGQKAFATRYDQYIRNKTNIYTCSINGVPYSLSLVCIDGKPTFSFCWLFVWLIIYFACTHIPGYMACIRIATNFANKCIFINYGLFISDAHL